jgi:hypothetical protein
MGEHELKFGAQYTASEGNWQGGYFHGYANFAYPYPYNYGPATSWWWNGPESWQWGTDENPVIPFYNNKTFRNPWLTVRQAKSQGLFIDDTWTVNNRLTFDIGFRYDNMTAKYGEGAVYEMPTTPEDINNPVLLRTRPGTDNIFDFDTFSPRLGLAYILTEDQKTVLRAHVGRYYAPMGVESLRRFGPDMEPALVENWRYFLPFSQVDLNGNGRVDFDEVRPATRLLIGREPDVLNASYLSDPSWSLEVEDGTGSPYTDQFHVSVARQLGSDLSIEAGYIYKNTQDLIALRPYNELTGEYWEWDEVPFTTFTGFETTVWEIARRDYTGDGKIDQLDAQFILDNNNTRAGNIDEFNGESVDRIYHGLQLVLNKRYSNRWQGLAAINWNESDGFAPRPVDQNWYIDGPMVMDTPFGSTLNHFQNNIEGPLPMTPELMVKLSGSYLMPVIETDLGLRVRYDSGRAFFPVQGLPTYQSWMVNNPLPPGILFGTASHEFLVAGNPNEPDWTPPTTIVDLSLNKGLSVGRGYTVNLSFDVLNALNENSPNRVGFHQGDYGRVYGLVSPRTYRGGVKFMF